MIQRVRVLIDNSLDKVLAYPNEAQNHIAFVRHLLHKYPDTGTRINEDDERKEFAEKNKN